MTEYLWVNKSTCFNSLSNILFYSTKTDDELTAEEEQKIADRKTEQASEKTAAIEEFTKKVGERFTKAKELFDTMIGKYETRLNEIKKVYIANYNKCLERRTTYFVDYEQKLDEQIAKMREALVKKLDFVSNWRNIKANGFKVVF